MYLRINKMHSAFPPPIREVCGNHDRGGRPGLAYGHTVAGQRRTRLQLLCKRTGFASV